MFNGEFKSIFELVSVFKDEQTCIDHLTELRWNGNVVSPFDESSKVYVCKDNKFRCKNTGKYFNVKTGTLFDNTKISLQTWFMAIYLVTSHKKSISSLQLGRDLNVTQKTAWFMLQRIRNCFGIDNNTDLNNEVELDETYVDGKYENSHNDKKVTDSQERFLKAKTPVFDMVEREGKFVAKKVEDTKAKTIISEIIQIVKDTFIYTDENLSYHSIQRKYDINFVKHNQGQFVDGRVHTNNIEGFWSLLKSGIFGIFPFTSKKHIQNYVDEFLFKYNTRNGTDYTRFNILLVNSQNRLTYNQLITK